MHDDEAKIRRGLGRLHDGAPESMQGQGLREANQASLVERLDYEIGSITMRLHKLQELREMIAKEPGLQVMEKYLSLKRDLGL